MKQIIFFLLFPLALAAQDNGLSEDSVEVIDPVEGSTYMEEEEEAHREPYKAPPLDPVALREVPAEQWDKATKGLDYSKDLPNPPKERKKRERDSPESSVDWTQLTQGLGSIFQLLAVLLALGVIAYGIYWMMQAPRNRTLSTDGTEITLSNLDEYIHETDLERFLREALNASNWPLAVRIYFLQAIKLLSDKGAIAWSKEKTNRDYLRELRNHPNGTRFRDVTRQYEQIWYGNRPLTSAEFALLEPELKAFLRDI